MAQENTMPKVYLEVVMEATGGYHQKIANFSVEKGYDVSIVLSQNLLIFIKFIIKPALWIIDNII